MLDCQPVECRFDHLAGRRCRDLAFRDVTVSIERQETTLCLKKTLNFLFFE